MIIRASTTGQLMVQVLGVNVSRIWTIGFAIGIGLAALGRGHLSAHDGGDPGHGSRYDHGCLCRHGCGGTGSLGGAIVGGLFIGLVVAITSFIAGEYATVSIYFCMAVILLIRPRGLFGEDQERIKGVSKWRSGRTGEQD